MIASLLILQKHIEGYYTLDEAELIANEDAVATLCQHITVEQAQIYRQYVNKEIAESMVNQCYRFLVQLLDQAYRIPRADSLFLLVQQLMCSFELCYGLHIHENNSLPQYEIDQLKSYVDEHLGSILAELKKKKINSGFVNEIQHAMYTLFKAGKQPELQYHHRQYIPRLIQTLRQIAYDERSKDWEYRLTAVLVQTNFNYLGFYNRWAAHQDQLLDQAFANGKGKEALLALEKEINTYQDPTLLGYNIHDRDLKAYMQEYLRLQRKQRKHAQDPKVDALYTVIPFNANGNQLKLIFHAFYKVNLFIAESKEEAAKCIAPHVRTREGTPLTVQSLAKHDKTKLEDQYPSVIRKLKESVKILEEEYRLQTKK